MPRKRLREAAPDRSVVAEPRVILRDRDHLENSLRSLECLITAYPRPVSAILQILVREGQTFAETPEGGRLMQKLSRSEWVERGRLLWEVFGLDELMAEEAPEWTLTSLPSTWIRQLVRSLSEDDLEPTLDSIMLNYRANPDGQSP